MDYGEILGTVVANNELGYEDTGNIETSSMAAGLGYAKQLTDKFSVGGQIKYARQSLGNSIIPVTDSIRTTTDNNSGLLAFDFGTYYKTGFRSLTLGLAVRNFAREAKYVQESFQLPLTFALGVSMNLVEAVNFKSEDQKLMFAFQASNARSHAEQVSFGLEYEFRNIIALRGGYVTRNDEDDFTFGFGVSAVGLTLDYAYTPFGEFDKVQRFSVRFSR